MLSLSKLNISSGRRFLRKLSISPNVASAVKNNLPIVSLQDGMKELPLVESVTCDTIYDIIKRSKYAAEVTPLYICNPVIGKESCWNPLGTKISSNEKNSPLNVAPNKYMTIRLDGKNFSKVVPRLQILGIFSKGYSVEFENIMKEIARYLTKSFCKVLYEFTQSDEITIVIDNVNYPSDGNYVHEHGGRKDKLITLASSRVSAKFTTEVIKLVASKKLDMLETLEKLPEMTFDARLGSYDTLEEAFELVSWRAYDCSVNGLSQAMYFLPDSRNKVGLNCTDKLKYLLEQNALPLTPHQAYGTFLKRNVELVEFENKLTGEKHTKEKKVFVCVEGPVIRNLKENVFVLLKKQK